MEGDKEFSTVSIPAVLFQKIEERIKGTGFNSVSDYVIYVLIEVVSDEEGGNESFTEEEQERIKRELRALGYLG
jgi:Arc/MetJ-type ribon-helix-helix transcriptional regulator